MAKIEVDQHQLEFIYHCMCDYMDGNLELLNNLGSIASQKTPLPKESKKNASKYIEKHLSLHRLVKKMTIIAPPGSPNKHESLVDINQRIKQLEIIKKNLNSCPLPSNDETVINIRFLEHQAPNRR